MFHPFASDVADHATSNQTCEKTRVDLVDFSPPDHDQMHVTNSEPSITLVKSNGCDLILHSAN